jgi:hypothetical protein
MKTLITLLILVLALPVAVNAETNTYRIAHTKYKNVNMVIINVNKSFFSGTASQQAKWFTAYEQCVRSANLAGQTIVVSNNNGGIRYYGPKSWHKFLNTIDMDWVNARINKKLTCTF